VTLQIDIVFDAVCPWCFIGKRRLEHALAARPAPPPSLRWRPFLLNPQMPPQGMERAAYLVQKFGSKQRVSRVYAAIAAAGQTVGIDFAFEKIRVTPSTVDPHRLVMFADREGQAGEMVEALFRAYFLDGENIGDRKVLAALARQIGLGDTARAYLESEADIAYVHQQNAWAHRQGIGGVPTYIVDGRLAISGAHEPNVIARLLDVAREHRLSGHDLPPAEGQSAADRL
jgi:predicted DsbA family dithiol-disulfide isomerase